MNSKLEDYTNNFSYKLGLHHEQKGNYELAEKYFLDVLNMHENRVAVFISLENIYKKISNNNKLLCLYYIYRYFSDYSPNDRVKCYNETFKNDKNVPSIIKQMLAYFWFTSYETKKLNKKVLKLQKRYRKKYTLGEEYKQWKRTIFDRCVDILKELD